MLGASCEDARIVLVLSEGSKVVMMGGSLGYIAN